MFPFCAYDRFIECFRRLSGKRIIKAGAFASDILVSVYHKYNS